MRGRSVCVRACKCESECVSARRREESNEKGGVYVVRQRQTIMNTKLRRYQRRAKGTGKRISGIGIKKKREREMNSLNVNMAEISVQSEV